MTILVFFFFFANFGWLVNSEQRRWVFFLGGRGGGDVSQWPFLLDLVFWLGDGGIE